MLYYYSPSLFSSSALLGSPVAFLITNGVCRRVFRRRSVCVLVSTPESMLSSEFLVAMPKPTRITKPQPSNTRPLSSALVILCEKSSGCPILSEPTRRSVASSKTLRGASPTAGNGQHFSRGQAIPLLSPPQKKKCPIGKSSLPTSTPQRDPKERRSANGAGGLLMRSTSVCFETALTIASSSAQPFRLRSCLYADTNRSLKMRGQQVFRTCARSHQLIRVASPATISISLFIRFFSVTFVPSPQRTFAPRAASFPTRFPLVGDLSVPPIVFHDPCRVERIVVHLFEPSLSDRFHSLSSGFGGQAPTGRPASITPAPVPSTHTFLERTESRSP